MLTWDPDGDIIIVTPRGDQSAAAVATVPEEACTSATRSASPPATGTAAGVEDAAAPP